MTGGSMTGELADRLLVFRTLTLTWRRRRRRAKNNMNLICLIDLNTFSHFGVSLQMFAYLTAICNKCINKNTKNWYTIDALGAIFAIFTILLQNCWQCRHCWQCWHCWNCWQGWHCWNCSLTTLYINTFQAIWNNSML